MPYNPSSAYPRHSTYTPPVEGRGFARAINEPPWAGGGGRSPSILGADIRGAIQKAVTPGSSENIAVGMQAMGRRGIVSNALTTVRQRSEQQRNTRISRRAWNRAEYGDDPNEVVNASDISQKPRAMPTAMESAGGREHVAGINERLGAISQREETSTAMDEVVDNIFSGKAGGPMKIPKLVSGWSRRRGGA